MDVAIFIWHHLNEFYDPQTWWPCKLTCKAVLIIKNGFYRLTAWQIEDFIQFHILIKWWTQFYLTYIRFSRICQAGTFCQGFFRVSDNMMDSHLQGRLDLSHVKAETYTPLVNSEDSGGSWRPQAWYMAQNYKVSTFLTLNHHSGTQVIAKIPALCQPQE